MNGLWVFVIALAWLALFAGGWLGWQLLRQNGRVLLRLEEVEQRLNELEFGKSDQPEALLPGSDAPGFELPNLTGERSEISPNSDNRENRFNTRSLTRSRIKRDGLKAGTPAPDFRLPRLDGRGELSLKEFRGRRVLLVFSSPDCGPCTALAPQLEKFHREERRRVGSTSPPRESEPFTPLEVVMISKGEAKENRAKVKEHGLTFPILLQQQWEISRRYAMFATPIAYLVDETGVIACDVAVGTDPIMELLHRGAVPIFHHFI